MLVEIIGYVAALLISTMAIPQMVKAYKSKSTGDISIISLVMRLTGTMLWMVYAISNSLWPMIIGNVVITINYSILIWLKLNYK